MQKIEEEKEKLTGREDPNDPKKEKKKKMLMYQMTGLMMTFIVYQIIILVQSLLYNVLFSII